MRLDVRLIPLLEAISQGATLAGAVASVGLSYRAAWGLLRDTESLVGAPLVALQQGKGALLTPLGSQLLQANAETLRRVADIAIDVAFGRDKLDRHDKARNTAPLRLAASHDLALARVCTSDPAKQVVELAVQGSLTSLALYARGEADIAGFHLPVDAGDEETAPYAKLLNARRDRIIPFVERTQGLIVAAGNPKRIRNLRDLASRRLRFVNRQRGSGTRLVVDAVLHRAGIRPAAIEGYEVEEFTHLAVAATVAAGNADCGVGLEAAARDFSLDFVPLVIERYVFAVRAVDLADGRLEAFSSLVCGARAQRITRTLPGYRPAIGRAPLTVASITGRDEPSRTRRRTVRG